MPITTALAVSFAALALVALVALVQQLQIRQLQRQVREGFRRTENALNKGKAATRLQSDSGALKKIS